MPFLFDSHTHLQFSAFDKDREKVIKRALDSNIWIVNAGSQKDTSKKAVELANKYSEGVYAAVGLHPIHTNSIHLDPQEIGGGNGFNSRSENFDYEFYKKIALNEKVVAIGECGLDYYRSAQIKNLKIKNKNDDLRFENLKEIQKNTFVQQIKLAKELNKPLMIHCREAFDDVIQILSSNSQLLNTPPGIIHFFTGTIEDARTLLEMGFYFTFGGLITYNRQFDEIIKFIPLEKILLETDAPYVAPEPHKGKRNEPIYIQETAKELAKIKNISLEKISEQTTQNAFKIFDIEK